MNWVSSASGKGINIDVDIFCGKTEPRASILESQEKCFGEGHPSQEGRPTLKTGVGGGMMLVWVSRLKGPGPRSVPWTIPQRTLGQRQSRGVKNGLQETDSRGLIPALLLTRCETLAKYS